MNATETVKALREWADKLEAAQPSGERVSIEIVVDQISSEAQLCEWLQVMRAPGVFVSGDTNWVKDKQGDVELVCFHAGFGIDPDSPDLAGFIKQHSAEAPC